MSTIAKWFQTKYGVGGGIMGERWVRTDGREASGLPSPTGGKDFSRSAAAACRKSSNIDTRGRRRTNGHRAADCVRGSSRNYEDWAVWVL